MSHPCVQGRPGPSDKHHGPVGVTPVRAGETGLFLYVRENSSHPCVQGRPAGRVNSLRVGESG